jgi:hypothetical protein
MRSVQPSCLGLSRAFASRRNFPGRQCNHSDTYRFVARNAKCRDTLCARLKWAEVSLKAWAVWLSNTGRGSLSKRAEQPAAGIRRMVRYAVMACETIRRPKREYRCFFRDRREQTVGTSVKEFHSESRVPARPKDHAWRSAARPLSHAYKLPTS